jgi:hypothetical protein
MLRVREVLAGNSLECVATRWFKQTPSSFYWQDLEAMRESHRQAGTRVSTNPEKGFKRPMQRGRARFTSVGG